MTSHTRRGIAGGGLVVLGTVAAIAFGATDREPAGSGGAPKDRHDATLIAGAAPGETLVDRRGKPLRDAKGRVLVRDKSGKVRAVSKSGKLVTPKGVDEATGTPTADTRTPTATPGRKQKARPKEKRSARRASPTATSAQPPVRLALLYQDPGDMQRLYDAYDVDLKLGDPAGQAKAVADHINAAGGIAGRRIELHTVSHATRLGRESQMSQSAWGQAMCERLTQGGTPLAVIMNQTTPAAQACLAQRGVVQVIDMPHGLPASDLTHYADHLFMPGSLARERMVAPLVAALKDTRFIEPRARVGIIALDRDAWSPAYAALSRELKAAGANVVIQRRVASSSAAALVTDLQGVVLAFRSARVDHVVTLDELAAVTGLFMRLSDSQGYRPLHAVTSATVPAMLVGNVPRRQLEGAVGIGWLPSYDVNMGDDPGGRPQRDRCAGIYKAADVYPGGTVYARADGERYCDGLLALDVALEKTRRFDPGGIRAGLEGDGLSSSITFRPRLTGAFHDGATVGRILRFNEGCGCFRYEGTPRALR